MAQDSTPEAASLFTDLGLPELTITATDAGLSIDQSEIPAGRYLVTLVDETSPAQALELQVAVGGDRRIEPRDFGGVAESPGERLIDENEHSPSALPYGRFQVQPRLAFD